MYRDHFVLFLKSASESTSISIKITVKKIKVKKEIGNQSHKEKLSEVMYYDKC